MLKKRFIETLTEYELIDRGDHIVIGLSGGPDSVCLFDLLLNEVQIIGTPGAGFGSCGEGYFRFSTFGDPEDTRIAAERLKGLLS